MMILKLEPEPGDQIEATFKRAINLSELTKCRIDFEFNEVKCIARPGGDSTKGVRQYYEALESKKPYKLAVT